MENLVRDIRMSLAAGMRVSLPGVGVFTVERQPACVRSGAVCPPEVRTVFIQEQSDAGPLETSPAQDALAQEIRRQTADGRHFRIAGWGTFVREAQTARYVLEDAREDLLAFPVIQLPEVQDEAEVMFEPAFAGTLESENSPSEPVSSEPVSSVSAPSESAPLVPAPSVSVSSEPAPPVPAPPAATAGLRPSGASGVPGTSGTSGKSGARASGTSGHSGRSGRSGHVRHRRRRSPWLLVPVLLLLLAGIAAASYFAYVYFNPPERTMASVASPDAAQAPDAMPSTAAAVPAEQTGAPAVQPEPAGATAAPAVQPASAPPVSAPSDAAQPASAPPSTTVADRTHDTGNAAPDLTVYEPEASVRYYVVVGSLTSASQAVSQIKAMSQAGGHALRIVRFDTSLYRLVAGGCKTYAEASALLEEVRAYAPKAWIFQHR